MTPMAPDPFAALHNGALAPEDVARRLRWRARRGLLENDLLLERFFRNWGERLTMNDHNGLASLLDLTDNDLLDLLVARKMPEGDLDTEDVRQVLAKIRSDS